jgi:acyl-CoA thioester hydrolase
MSWRPSVYRCGIEPQWIDYNGHLRDAYYALVFSHATDALMDEVGLDHGYRARTSCTLYTLEMHVHFLDEVKSTDEISVSARAIGIDSKRIHLALALHCARLAEPAALGEFMLLHVQQAPTARSVVFAPEIQQRLEQWLAADGQSPLPALGSRAMTLPRR